MSTLYWLSDDLRLQDNPALAAAAQDDALAIIFCIDEQRFKTDRFGNRQMGSHRWRFLRESLLDLQHCLAELGQTLNLVTGNPREVVSSLLSTGRFNRIVRTRPHSIDETVIWQFLSEAFPGISFEAVDGSTLYLQDTINFGAEFPETFTQFRRSLDGVAFRSPINPPIRLPAPTSYEIDNRLVQTPDEIRHPSGGATTGRQSLEAYFNTDAVYRYKDTRNNFSGERSSTGFSPWLAQGCISPVQIFDQLCHYESENGASESTEWILFELMWREFFRWHANHHGAALFEFTGIAGKRPLTTFYRERFLKWRDGKTPWPIVNACMNELKETGLLSKLGRQIVASCLVNELGLDWRCGAGYFEEQLIDYDACSNWGNWQYVAGVGSDPRGGRHVHLEKQTETWDKEGTYLRRWAGKIVAEPLDSLANYDWPVEAKKMTHRKPHLPEKTCQACGRAFFWRKKWVRDWANVKYCGERCRLKPKQAQVMR